MPVDASMVSLFKAELKLCGIGSGDTVAVLSEGEIRADYAPAFLAAAQALGAFAVQVNLPPRSEFLLEDQTGRNPLTGNRLAIETLSRATLVVDLMGLLFSPEQAEITAAGARVLLVVEPYHVLQSMFPTREIRARVERAEARLRAARTMRITSPAGTDVHYQLGQYPVMTQYGYTDTPGRWDHFPSGFLLTHGNDGGVSGRVVMAPGDILTSMRRYVTTPVIFTIANGYVTAIEGDGIDAALLRGYIESYNDPRAYAVSHIGWGMHEAAKWHHLAATRTADAEIGVHALSFYGNVLFSLGPNTELGGENDTACHLDLPLKGCDLYLDGEAMVQAGRVIPPDLRAAGW